MLRHAHLQWLRPVRQARSEQTLERLLDSAEALIADKGFDDVAVAEIAARAGLSVGAVYARFRDKRGLLHCLQDRFVEEAHLTIDASFDLERWEGASIEEMASEMIAFLVEIHRERGGVLREMLVRRGADPSVLARRNRLVAHLSDRLTALLRDQSDRIEHPRSAEAVAFGLAFVLGTLEQAILFSDTGAHGIPASDEVLAAELTRAFLGYLGVRGPAPASQSPGPSGGQPNDDPKE